LVRDNSQESQRNNRDKQVKDTAFQYRRQYAYREGLKQLLTDLRDSNKGSRLLVYTTPVSEPYFCVMVKENRLPDYERWLREMVEVFGQVWHFEYLHSTARDYENTFSDGHHFYPWVGTFIAHKLTGEPDPGIPSDFGILLDRANIEEWLITLRRDALETCGN
jgi:hypothetical protein